MTPRFSAAAFALAASSLLLPLPALAECSTAETGARCIRMLEDVAPAEDAGAMSSGSAPTAQVDVGAVLPRGEYSIILNADYYGLPPVSDGWVYMRVGGDAYRVDWQTHEVLERVTEQTSANF